jgi:hypothetical protein
VPWVKYNRRERLSSALAVRSQNVSENPFARFPAYFFAAALITNLALAHLFVCPVFRSLISNSHQRRS